MSGVRCGLAGALALALALAATPARAQVIDGSEPTQPLILTVGTLAGLTNSIATIVYAAQNRSFDHGWVISSFVAGAICGAFAVGLTVESAENGDGPLMGAALGYYALALWPAGWAVRGAFSEVDPGERFDAAEARPVLTRDPFAPLRAPAPAAAWVGLPAVRF